MVHLKSGCFDRQLLDCSFRQCLWMVRMSIYGILTYHLCMAMDIWEFALSFIRKRMLYIHNSTFAGVFGSHGD